MKHMDNYMDNKRTTTDTTKSLNQSVNQCGPYIPNYLESVHNYKHAIITVPRKPCMSSGMFFRKKLFVVFLLVAYLQNPVTAKKSNLQSKQGSKALSYAKYVHSYTVCTYSMNSIYFKQSKSILITLDSKPANIRKARD